LESKVDELRSVASVGSIPGAPQVITSTDGLSGTFVTTRIPTSPISAESTGRTQPTGSSTTLSGTRVTSTTPNSATTAAIGSGSSSSTSTGFAAVTQVPAAVAVLALLGAVAAL
jgi:hypothetical protein